MHSAARVIGVGNPIVDELAHVDPAFVAAAGGAKGGMELVDHEALAALAAQLPARPARAAGGSAGNTAFALARLGVPTAMIGKLGDDEAGRFYRDRLAGAGGFTDRFLLDGAQPTGRCLCLVTPDSERTMRTHLGAAMTLTPAEIAPALFDGAEHVHVEGYLLFNPDLIRAVLNAAARDGRTVSLDLASFEVVHAARAELDRLLAEYVDIVFANEEEAAAFAADADPARGLAALAAHCRTAVVKLGADGALLQEDARVVRAPAEAVARVVDTTGAGDYWAAGFLRGYLDGRGLETSARLGARMGALVVQQLGAALPEADWPAVRAWADEQAGATAGV